MHFSEKLNLYLHPQEAYQDVSPYSLKTKGEVSQLDPYFRSFAHHVYVDVPPVLILYVLIMLHVHQRITS